MAKVAVEKTRQPAPVWTVDPLLSYTATPGSPRETNGGGVENSAFFDNESGLCAKLSVVRVLERTKKKDRTWTDGGLTVSYSKRQCNTRVLLVLLSAIVLFLLIATIATVVYLAVEVRMTWDEEKEESQETDAGISLVEGQLRITNRVFTADLLNSSSSSYHTLSAQVRQALDAVFLQSGLAPYYNETGVTGFSEGSVITRCQIHLSVPRHDATRLVGMAVIQSLERHHGYLPGGVLQVDIRSLHFTGLLNEVTEASVLGKSPIALWSSWSEWSPCQANCGVQTRFRECIDEYGVGRSPDENGPCGSSGSTNKEFRNCPCDLESEPPTTEQTTPKGTDEECVGDCEGGQVCLLLPQSSVARCLVPRDADDPTGCGGWCLGDGQICRHLGKGTFQCLDNFECENESQDWKCDNGLCIPLAQRCDGRLDCYDMSDEYDCDCHDGEFHCGNNTSCLVPNKRCNGQVDCWDGSDELNCTLLCPTNEYTCNSGKCIDKLHFCDGYADCDDASDEPQGCNAPCLHTQNQCRNGRCVNILLWCNGVDNCGDETDETACDSPHLLRMNSDDHGISSENAVQKTFPGIPTN